MSTSLVHCVETQYAMGAPVNPVHWQDNRGGSNKNFFMNIVPQLARFGHRVRAFGPFPCRMFHQGVEWCPIAELDRHGKPDVLWACYDTRPLIGKHGMLRIGSHHTYKIDQCLWEYCDVNTAPSLAAVDELRKRYAPHGQWEVQPNAVEDDLLPWAPVPGRVIYHTSQDRGLRLLLKVWPEIRARVPGATLHIVASLHPRDHKWPRGTEDCVEMVRLRELWVNMDRAIEAGGVTHMENVPRATVLRELREASCFAFPVSSAYACETFSVATMECCRMGIPVVMAPQDALESIYRGSVILTPAPADENLGEFTDAVVQVLSDPIVRARYSALGRKLAEPYTYVNAARALSNIICARTGFKATEPAVARISEVAPEVLVEAMRPKAVRPGGKRIAFLLDPHDCYRPINPERIFTDPRGLTGTDVTSFQLAVEMGRRRHDVTWFTNLTHDHEGRGIRFARYEHWVQTESAERWDVAVSTLSPAPLELARNTGLRVYNCQVNDFGAAWQDWECYVDVATALSRAHEKQLRRFTDFAEWRTLPNGVDPSAYHDGDRHNHKMVWASSPDRGLHWLLELFPRLKAALPDVTLDVFYLYRADAATGKGENANRYRYMNAALEKFDGKGVRFHGSASRQRVAEAFSTSRVLPYTCHPSGWTEGFSCTTLEAAVAGCLPVIAGANALGEIYGEYVPTTPHPYPENKEHYFGNLVRALTDNAWYFERQAKARELAALYNWKAVGDRLEEILGVRGEEVAA